MFVLQARSGLSNAINGQRPVNRYLENDKSLLKKEEEEEEEEEKEEDEDDKDVKEGVEYKVVSSSSVNATNGLGKNNDHYDDNEQMVNHVCDSEHC